MIQNTLRKLHDFRQPHSITIKLRKKRFAFFKSLIESLPRPLKILDAGGIQVFWEKMEFCEEPGVIIVLLNLHKERINYSNFYSVVGDVRNLSQFKDKEFDVVFSNALIQDLGNYEDQRRMANEIRRVGKRYFVQAPNRFFPIEPHFLFPFFQFFPAPIQVWLHTHFDLGYRRKIPDRQKAIAELNSIKLPCKKELIEFFPDAKIVEETFFGLTKSFMVVKF